MTYHSKDSQSSMRLCSPICRAILYCQADPLSTIDMLQQSERSSRCCLIEVHQASALFDRPAHEDRQIEKGLHYSEVLAIDRFVRQDRLAQVDQWRNQRCYCVFRKTPFEVVNVPGREACHRNDQCNKRGIFALLRVFVPAHKLRSVKYRPD